MSHNDVDPGSNAKYYRGFRECPSRDVDWRKNVQGYCVTMHGLRLISCFKCGDPIKVIRHSWMPVRKHRGKFTRRKTPQPVTVFNPKRNMWVLQHVNCTSEKTFDECYPTSTDEEESSASTTTAMSHNPARGSGGGGEEGSSGASGSGGLQAGSSNDGGNPAPSNVALVRNGLSYKNPADPGWQR